MRTCPFSGCPSPVPDNRLLCAGHWSELTRLERHSLTQAVLERSAGQISDQAYYHAVMSVVRAVEQRLMTARRDLAKTAEIKGDA